MSLFETSLVYRIQGQPRINKERNPVSKTKNKTKTTNQTNKKQFRKGAGEAGLTWFHSTFRALLPTGGIEGKGKTIKKDEEKHTFLK